MVKHFDAAIRVIMCTVFHDQQHLFEAIEQGANGYILKTSPASEIEAAIVKSWEGGAPVTPQMASFLFRALRQNQVAPPVEEVLTRREQEIMEVLVKGWTYKEAAAALHISLSTVRTHIENIYLKMEVNSKAEAVAKYLQKKA